MDKKKLPAIKARVEEVAQSMETDSTALGNPTGIRALAEAVIELIEALDRD